MDDQAEEELFEHDEPHCDAKEDDSAELVEFREQWKNELGFKADSPSSLPKEDEAVDLYWMGAAAEKRGDMGSAIMYYRQAVQLVPDVEFKACSKEPDKLQNELEDGDYDNDQSESQSEVSVITEQFEALHLESVCQPARRHRSTHISVLPVEVIRYILCWVISAECDMRSLELFGQVCRGFYLLSREPTMWRTACRKLWGECAPVLYGESWRNMFIYKPHLNFNGVYISKTSYVRPGESSLDGLYKAYHTVIYFRYLRFFADGTVMYQTSPLDPSQVVGKLCHKHSSDAVLLGKYSVHNDSVSVDVFSYRCRHQQQNLRKRESKPTKEITHEQRFHMDFLLKNGGGQRFNKLEWQCHCCHTLHRPTGQVQVADFNIDYKYTTFYFSRVKRFTKNSRGIL